MSTFVTAYLVVWLGTLLYVWRLHARQQCLEEDLQALQSQLDQTEQQRPQVISRAA